MTNKEKDLVIYFLQEYKTELSSNTSNDIDDFLFNDFNIKEKKQLVKDYYDMNGDPGYKNSKIYHIDLITLLIMKLKDEMKDS